MGEGEGREVLLYLKIFFIILSAFLSFIMPISTGNILVYGLVGLFLI